MPIGAEEEIFFSRDDGKGPPFERIPLYAAFVPESWKKEDPAEKISLKNTMLPNVTFWIDDLPLTFHTFPFLDASERIPPDAQIQRWSKQFDSTPPVFEKATPQAFGGFFGYRFEKLGTIQGKPTYLLAFSMQLAKEHLKTLSRKKDLRSQKSLSDWTIKVVGDPEKVQKNRDDILDFARSLHLIYPL